jgi:hypothetical protein
MSKYHAVSSGMVTRSALPSITRQRGTTTGSANLMLYGAGKTTVSNNTTFVDSSANAFTVTRNGDTVQTGFNPFSQASAGSGYFDGTGDWLTVPSNAAFQYGTGNFTIELWLYSSAYPSVGAFHNIYDGRGANYLQTQLCLYLYNSSGVIQITVDSGATAVVSQTYTPALNTWNHIAIVRNSGTVTVYLNGVSIGSSALSTNYTASYTNYIGSYDGTQSFVNGYISNFRVVKGTAVYTSNFTPPTSPLTAITNTSLLLLMDNYSIVNSTSTNLPVTINGNTTISTAQFPTGMSSSIYFDGTGDYLTVPNASALQLNNTTAFTIEFLVYPTSLPTPSYIIENYNQSSPYQGYSVAYSVGGTGTITFWDGGGLWINTGITLSLNQWTHIAITYEGSGSTRRFFKNGVQSGSAGTVPSGINYTSGACSIGAQEAGITPWNGYISNLRICKGTALYTANFTPPALPMSTTVTVPAYVTNNIYGVNQIP